MALEVLDLDFAALPERLDPQPGYEGACVLLRIDGRPRGQAILSYDKFDPEAPLDRQLAEAANSSFWESWLARELGVVEDEPGCAPEALPSASVAICTRERPDDLEKCLQGLQAMSVVPEILVVDNAPATEATRAVVERHPAVRYVVEPRKGLNFARNTAIEHARGEIVVFIDDDAVPDREWFANLVRNFDDPLVMAATGLTMALELESEAQIAFQRLGGFGRGFKRVVHDAIKIEPFEGWIAGAGVNLALRRSAVDLVGPFDPALDAGTASRAGGDTDYFRRLLSAGYKIVYDPHALNWHRHRRSMEELEQQIHGYECGYFAILTKALLFERNPRAVTTLARWLRHQIPAVLRARRRSADYKVPFRIPIAQAVGACSGPGGYLRARREARRS